MPGEGRSLQVENSICQRRGVQGDLFDLISGDQSIAVPLSACDVTMPRQTHSTNALVNSSYCKTVAFATAKVVIKYSTLTSKKTCYEGRHTVSAPIRTPGVMSTEARYNGCIRAVSKDVVEGRRGAFPAS